VVVTLASSLGACRKKAAPAAQVASATAASSVGRPGSALPSSSADPPVPANEEPRDTDASDLPAWAKNRWSLRACSLVHRQGAQLLVVRLDAKAQVVRLVDPDGQAFECASVSPNGTALFSRSRQTARLWDLTTGKLVQSQPLRQPGREERCTDVRWHPRGEVLFTQSTLWHREPPSVLSLGGEPDDSDAGGLSDSGNLYWARTNDGFVLRDVNTQAEAGRVTGGGSLQLDPTERYVAVSSTKDDNPVAEVWSLRPLQRLWRREEFVFVAFSPDGAHFAGMERNWAARKRAGLFHTLDGKPLASWNPASSECSAGSGWSSDGKRYAWLDDEHIVAVDTERRKKQPFKPLEGELCSFEGIAVDTNGQYFATSQRLFGFSPPRAIGRFVRECASCQLRPDIPPVSFSADGQWVATLLETAPPVTGVFRTTPFRTDATLKLAGIGSWIPGTQLIALPLVDDVDAIKIVRVSDESWVRVSAESPDQPQLASLLESPKGP
jgi:WD40 repeat protein